YLNETLKRKLDEDPKYILPQKRIRIQEDWKEYKDPNDVPVKLPHSWIEILKGDNLKPATRSQFDHLKKNLQPGNQIEIPSLGQAPKDFGTYASSFLITDQMLELWNEISSEQKTTYRRVLSGPTGVGKSYLSFFLAARAYAENWLILYIADAGDLVTEKSADSYKIVIKYFLAMNSDILTAAELEELTCEYNGERDIWSTAIGPLFEMLKQKSRKTLTIIDEHGKLFRTKEPIPDKFVSLKYLSKFAEWKDDNKGSRLILTGTAHAKYEMEYMEPSFRSTSIMYVGPLSKDMFKNLWKIYPRLHQLDFEEVVKFTNCVPRELIHLAKKVDDFPGVPAEEILEKHSAERVDEFLAIAENYYQENTELKKSSFYNMLLKTFLGGSSSCAFEWKFIDLGLVYRRRDPISSEVTYHILCLPAQKALLELLKSMPIQEDI
ncbi:hypothetical protein BGZ49_003228, partial [Haplosporangium sp. Z 27]